MTNVGKKSGILLRGYGDIMLTECGVYENMVCVFQTRKCLCGLDSASQTEINQTNARCQL